MVASGRRDGPGSTQGAPGRRLLAVNLYYAPDVASSGQLLSELCAGLAALGTEVRVIAGQPSYTPDAVAAPASEVLNGVNVERVDLGEARGRERITSRLKGYVLFMWRAWRAAVAAAERERPDAVLTLSNPPFVGLIGARLARRFRIPYYYVLYDIHPDALKASGFVRLPPGAVFAWNRVNRWIFNRAERVIVPGSAMRDTLVQSKGVPPERVAVIPNWARPELGPGDRLQPIREELGIGPEDVLVLYAGNMGIMHPLDPILDAAGTLRDTPLRFVFVGDGARRESMEARVRSERLGNVTFLPYQPEARFRELLAASDACFVVLEPGMERFAVPSRAYTFLSAGKPLLTSMAPDGDIARLVAKAGCGWNIQGVSELAALLRRLAADRDEIAERGLAGRRVYEETYRRDRIIRRYADLLGG